ncbi:hypothetical protein DLAC_01434 [Tieghemostelium lacteum]|uniref:DEP domain-containing protein n=1 Tax=Tieghemostelium lacteum TaxID=361077 RepID=A0A152A5E4_TIELA|nr:hypothetical protein DLAC_01434 [Tieghemostelium lacteum]|eukprot:KYR01453.1 hypothetical protein DLAC_01434 [Tieghemostelium lacteum]
MLNEHQIRILLIFYRFIKRYLVFSHLKRGDKIVDENNNKYKYVRGYEIIEWLVISSVKIIDPVEAAAICQILLDYRFIIEYHCSCMTKNGISQCKSKVKHSLWMKSRKYLFSDIGYYTMVMLDKVVSYDEMFQYIRSIEKQNPQIDYNQHFYKIFPNNSQLVKIIYNIEYEKLIQTVQSPLPNNDHIDVNPQTMGDLSIPQEMKNEFTTQIPMAPLPPSDTILDIDRFNELKNMEISIPIPSDDDTDIDEKEKEEEKLSELRNKDLGYIEPDDTVIIPPIIKRIELEDIKTEIIQSPTNNNYNHENEYIRFVHGNYHPVELDLDDIKWIKFIPVLIFLAVLSTSGMAVQWKNMHIIFNTPRFIYIIFAVVASFFWVTSFFTMVYSWRYRGTLFRMLRDKNQVTILASISMSLFQLSSLSFDFSVGLCKTLFWIGIVLQSMAIFLIYAQLIIRIKKDKDKTITPSFIFTGAGFVIAGGVASDLGYNTIKWITWGFSSIYCQIFFFIIIIGYYINGLLPKSLIPSQTILVGYVSLSFAAFVKIQHGLTPLGRVIYTIMWINVATTIVIWCIMLIYSPGNEIYFKCTYWGFVFPVVAMSSAVLNYYQYTPNSNACKILSIVAVSIADLDYAIILGLTLYYLFTKNLFIPSKV